MNNFSSRKAIVIFVMLALLVGAMAGVASADTNPFPILTGAPVKGCYGAAVSGAGMWNGNATVNIDVPGPVVGAWLIWAGVNDLDDPGNPATNQLTVNGVTVTGNEIDHSTIASSNPDWYQWRADIGPNGANLVHQGANTLNITEWWPLPDYRRNGVSVMVLYDRGTCTDPDQVTLFDGMDYVWWPAAPQYDGGPLSQLHVFTFDPAPMDRTATVTLNFAGTDHHALEEGICRGVGIWEAAGTGTPPDAIVKTAWPRSVGINGGVLIADKPFATNPPCTPEITYPATDYSGGYDGAEWSTATLKIVIPAGSEWVAFQIESEANQPPGNPGGESGAWVGGALQIPLPPPDVTVTKTDNVETPEPGDTLTYVVDFANIGPGDAHGVVLEDTLPGHSNYVSCTTDMGTCSYADGKVTITIGDMLSGDSGEAQIVVKLNDVFPAGQTHLVNTATISTSTVGDDPSNNTATDEDVVTAAPTLDITKTAAPSPVFSEDNLTYTINWSVGGNAYAVNTTVVDHLPTGVTFVSASDGGTLSGNDVTWNLGTKTPGDSGTLTLVVKAPKVTTPGTVLHNSVDISEQSGVTANATADTTVLVPAKVGDTIWHDRNANGTQDAGEEGLAGVTLALTKPGADGQCNTADDVAVATATTDANGHYLFDRLYPDNYCIHVTDSSGVTTGMYLTTGNEPLGPFTLTEGQEKMDADFGYALPPVLSLTKENNPSDVVNPGDTITYNLCYGNSGDIAKNTVMTDQLPQYTEYVAGSATNGGIYDDSTRTITWNIGDLLGGTQACASFQVQIPMTIPGLTGQTRSGRVLAFSEWSELLIHNVATIDADRTDPVEASADNTLHAVVDPAIYKGVDKEMIHRYDYVTFTITVTNRGNANATGVVVSDVIDENLENVSVSSDTGTASYDESTRTATVDLGTLAPQQVAIITIRASAKNVSAAMLPLDIPNTATLIFDQGNPRQSNEVVVTVVYFLPGEIPEGNTLLLLGSGLLGLAGYVNLRRKTWRKKK